MVQTPPMIHAIPQKTTKLVKEKLMKVSRYSVIAHKMLTFLPVMSETRLICIEGH